MKKSFILLDWDTTGGGCNDLDSTVVPSPTPPWRRPVKSPQVQIVTGNDTISLGVDVTYLQSIVQPQPVPPATTGIYTVALPNGNFMRQMHRIYIPTAQQPGSAPFRVTGAFNGFTSLLFNSAAISAVIEWDGSGWILVSGDAQKSN